MERTVQESIDGNATPPAPTGIRSHLLSFWNSKPVQIQLFRMTLILYLGGAVMDIVLATHYYYSGDFHWFGWTLVFLLAPSVVMSILSGLGIETVNNNVSKCDSLLLNILQLAMPLRYLDILQLLSTDKEVDGSRMSSLCHAHLMIAMFRNMPQLCLKIYIIDSTDEQVSVLEVISMVISLLAAVKAAVTYIYQGMMHSSDGRSNLRLVIMLTIWKLLELSARVLVIGLFASALKQWAVLPIGIHWLIMMACYVGSKIPIKDYKVAIEGGLLMAVGTFSSIFPQGNEWMYIVNVPLTSLGTLCMASGWMALAWPGANWYNLTALTIIGVETLMPLLIISALRCIM